MIPYLLGVFIFLLLANPVSAANSLVLNEILPYPLADTKEWVEFYNPNSQTTQANGFKITEKTSSGNVVSHNLADFSLGPNQVCYYQFNSSSLNNDQDTVSLLDTGGNTIDSYTYQNSIQNKSFARVPDGGSWLSGVDPSLGSLCSTSNEIDSTPLTISLSEFMPNPTKGNKEWVEIYNNSSNPTDLQGIQIDDGLNGSSPYTLPVGTSIQPFGYLVINLESMFNNSGDMVRLLGVDDSVIDQASYTDSDEGVAFARNQQGEWKETTTSTPNRPNLITLYSPTTVTTVKETTVTKTKTTTPTPPLTKTTITSTGSEVLGTQTASNEASSEINQIKLSFNDPAKKDIKVQTKGQSYSKFLQYGLIILGIVIIGTPIALFIKKKYV